MGIKIKKIIKKIQLKRTTVLLLVFILMAFVLVRQLFDLQIIQGENYINEFQTRTTKTRVLKSTRGNIYDKNNKLIASNVLSYSLTFEDNGTYDSTRQKNLTLNGVAYKVLKILAENGDQLSNSFHIKLDKDGNYAFDVEEGFTLSRFKADIYGHALIDDLTEDEAATTAEDMVAYLSGNKGFSIVLYGDDAYTDEELKKYGLPKELTKQEVLDIAIMRYELSTNSFQKYMAVTIATNVSESTVAAVMENQNELQGIDVLEDSVRQYVDDESMGPLLGYTGRASSEELESLKKENPDYSNDAIVGKAGIEQYMELELQGKDGQETVTVDNLGKVLKIDDNTTVEPVAGNDVYLSVDADWQSAIYQILKQRVAGILLNKIEAVKEYDYKGENDASRIIIPIYDVYNALIANSVIDIDKFSREEASDTEKNLYAKFQQKQQEVFDTITNRLTSSDPPAYKDESTEVQEYLTYICDTVLRDTLGVIDKNEVDTSDATYQAWANDQSISLKDYLNYAASQNWIDISVISPKGEYLDSEEIYQALTSYITDYLKTDTGFSKLLYKYLLMNDQITGQDICLVLYEQGVLSKEDDCYASLASGAMSAYDFMINKISNLEIEPAQLALAPCSASAVITDAKTGKVLACVSYPGYDNNKMANTVDAEYYARLNADKSSPQLNFATQYKAAPGSTFKIVSATAGLMENVINLQTKVNCVGTFTEITPSPRCWKISGHGYENVTSAIKDSCNYFFYNVGYQLATSSGSYNEEAGLETLSKYADLYGLTDKSGVEIGEYAPDVSTKDPVRSAIGQGSNSYTTVGLARYVTTIANSGTCYNLTLLDKTTDSRGNLLKEYHAEVRNQIDLPQEYWNAFHLGMRQVVENKKYFSDLAVNVAGKTGTAEQTASRPNHALFICYAPYENPEIAIATRIPFGYSSDYAAQFTRDIIKYYYGLAEEDDLITGTADSLDNAVSNEM